MLGVITTTEEILDFEKLKSGCCLIIRVTDGDLWSDEELHVAILDINEQHTLEGLPDTEYLDSEVAAKGHTVRYIKQFPLFSLH